MFWTYSVLLTVGLWPLYCAWRSCRGSSLENTIYWLAGAWLGWGIALLAGDMESVGWEKFRFLALTLSACPVVAVLGARFPYAAAWNFVVLGLLAVMLLPLVEMLLLGTRTLDWIRLTFLAVTLGIGILNYVPTRLFLLALWTGTALVLEFVVLVRDEVDPAFPAPTVRHVGLLLSPWLAWLLFMKPRADVTSFDALWLDFRDRYGLVWGQRAREQFNAAARNAGWEATLTWFGLRAGPAVPGDRLQETLRAVLKRFLPLVAKSEVSQMD